MWLTSELLIEQNDLREIPCQQTPTNGFDLGINALVTTPGIQT